MEHLLTLTYRGGSGLCYFVHECGSAHDEGCVSMAVLLRYLIEQIFLELTNYS